METLEDKVARVIEEDVSVVAYDPCWPGLFEEERNHLLSCLPRHLIRRIEHFGSTAVPGLAVKPIVDILVEVTNLDDTKKTIAPILEAQGYDYFLAAYMGRRHAAVLCLVHQARPEREQNVPYPYGRVALRSLGKAPVSGLPD